MLSILLLTYLIYCGVASSYRVDPGYAKDGEFVQRIYRLVQDSFPSEVNDDGNVEGLMADERLIMDPSANPDETTSEPIPDVTPERGVTPTESIVDVTEEQMPERTTKQSPDVTTIDGTTAPPRLIIDPNYREKVLDAHTKERGSLNATNMMHLVWDKELEELAWKRALTCKFEHGDYFLPDGTFVGQNLARFPHGTDPVAHVATWIYEKRWFDFNTRTCTNFAYCGHYNQMIWHQATRIGCAHHFCRNFGGDFMVCDYLDFGNYPDSGHPAFDVEGAPCSACDFPGGSACVQNQCFDCGNPDLPEGIVCRSHKAKPCVDNYSGCANILEDFCDHPSFTNFVKSFCAKHCGLCNW